MVWIRKKSSLIVMLADLIILGLSLFAALMLRFDCLFSEIPDAYIKNAQIYAVVSAATTLAIFFAGGLYRFVWRYIGIREILKICFYTAVANCLNILLSTLFHYALPRTVVMINLLLQLMFFVAMRYSYRLLHVLTEVGNKKRTSKTRIMIIGAGAAGRLLIREYTNSHYLQAKVCCLIDDNPIKKGRVLEGVPIVGGSDQILNAVKRYQIQLIILAMPSATGLRRKQLLEICQQTGCEVKIVPGVYQLLNGEVSVRKLRHVEINDLLGRNPITVDLTEILDYIQDQTVLVTGGGGSIGSELCRQIAQHQPKELIILDIYENNAYDIQQELKRNYPDLQLTVLIASVLDPVRMEQIFSRYRPDVVYHAAAHKHVPLMEDSPNEAIKNNVFGTFTTASLAIQYGAARFVLISTDKAVNPTNIMGASKRLCEMVIHSLSKKSDTRFATVRFGNVLGSNGSVIPLFKKQIEKGGPVTVTHPDIIRYFMTIPEAVSLVLQAGAYATDKDNIFVLDMGTPVRIDDLARNLIRLSGMTPDVDIEIRYTGLRPGEKLYEELLMNEEGLRKTPNQLIYIGAPIEMDLEQFQQDLKTLYEAAQQNSDQIFEIVAKIVPTFKHRPADVSAD